MVYPLEVRKTFIENWPPSLTGMSIKGKSLAVHDFDARVLGTFSARFIQETQFVTDEFFSDEFLADIQTATANFPSGVMPRLGYCSWKYSTLVNEPATTITDVLKIISRDDPRIGGFLARELIDEHEVFLYLREWRNIPPWSEFRLFIRDGKVVGVSQYHHQEAYPEIQENLEAIKVSLLHFFPQLIEALHMDTVVADVFVEQQVDGCFKATLIELNPFTPRTDPCLYSWRNGGDFDGGIRYRVLRYNPYRNAASVGGVAEPLNPHSRR